MPPRPLIGLVCGVLVTTTLGLSTGPVRAQEAAPDAGYGYPGGVRMIQANIRSSLSTRKFTSDAREVVRAEPDVITYNEVPVRVDWRLAPDGYSLYRSHRNRYTEATPVAWRTDRWRKIDSGTYRFSNYRRKPEGRKVRIGLRFANWVTLEAGNGRVMSVVSAHVAPPDDDMPDLLRRSVRRIGELVARLAPRGPVLVGGDFNVHYSGSRYPEKLLRDARMRPTYDTLRSSFPTGDHHDLTIDYVFNRGKAQLRAERHRPIELYSDHDAVVADLGWRVDAPG
jgi:endonuclease/exonuclease/phosphatase family metal-dependent hydrolase